jgi:hypothetical protein
VVDSELEGMRHRSAVIEAKSAWQSYETLCSNTDLESTTIKLAIEAAWQRYETARTALEEF